MKVIHNKIVRVSIYSCPSGVTTFECTVRELFARVCAWIPGRHGQECKLVQVTYSRDSNPTRSVATSDKVSQNW